jgi:hypothetical protein
VVTPFSSPPGLDPTWEATYEFPVTDENAKCFASFYMGEGETLKQIGDEQTYLLNVLIKDKPTFKAIIVSSTYKLHQ